MKTAQYNNFISVNAAPFGTTEISVYNSEGKRVGGFLPQKLRLPILGDKLYSCGVLSDVHVNRDYHLSSPPPNFRKALEYLKGCVNSIFICGDLTQYGTDAELQAYKNYIGTYSPNVPVYAISGNHDCRVANIANRISTYTNQPLYYSVEQGDDVFIMLGIVNEAEGSLFAAGELQWFYETLEANRNKRCFVFMHIRPKDGCGNALGLYTNHLWGGTERTVFESLLNHYPNVILFHGHSHTKLYMQEYDKTANYGKDFAGHSVHIPSATLPTYSSNGERVYDDNGSEGYVMDVYRNHIVLKGRDFKNGKDLLIAHYCLDTTVQNVAAKTFTDSTGTIKT